jgi:glutamate racemase
MPSISSYQITQKQELTVIVTDSGIGGVGIAAHVYHALKTQGPYENVRVIYYNALFEEKSGYNILKSMSQKTAIFDTALNGMLSYSPDVILLASNTLSVLYSYTTFSHSASIPIIGLIDIGVNHILQHIQENDNSAVVMFATPLTVQEGIFGKRLRQHLDDGCIVEQACRHLDFAIGDGDRETILRLIDQYVAEALQQVPVNTKRAYGSLHCTHFGYYQKEFFQAFQRYGPAFVEVLNPSIEMAKVLLSENCAPATAPEITIEFVSKVKFHPQGMASLLPYVNNISGDVALAFQNYTYRPALF